VVSSTLYQIIASETPIVIRDSRFVETIETDAYGFGPIVKYRNIHDLVHKLELLMLDEELVGDIKKEARAFVEKYGGDKIAQEFLDLAKTITK
jgi:glycosyltransferase involved in cell wall biosynthesis